MMAADNDNRISGKIISPQQPDDSSCSAEIGAETVTMDSKEFLGQQDDQLSGDVNGSFTGEVTTDLTQCNSSSKRQPIKINNGKFTADLKKAKKTATNRQKFRNFIQSQKVSTRKFSQTDKMFSSKTKVQKRTGKFSFSSQRLARIKVENTKKNFRFQPVAQDQKNARICEKCSTSAGNIKKAKLSSKPASEYMRNFEYVVRKCVRYYLKHGYPTSEIFQAFFEAFVALEPEIKNSEHSLYLFEILRDRTLANMNQLVCNQEFKDQTSVSRALQKMSLFKEPCRVLRYAFRLVHFVQQNLGKDKPEHINFIDELASILETENLYCSVIHSSKCGAWDTLKYCYEPITRDQLCPCRSRQKLSLILANFQYMLESLMDSIGNVHPELDLTSVCKLALRQLETELQDSTSEKSRDVYEAIFFLLEEPILQIESKACRQYLWSDIRLPLTDKMFLVDHAYDIFYFFFRFLALLIVAVKNQIADQLRFEMVCRIFQILENSPDLETLGLEFDPKDVFEYCACVGNE